MIEYVRLFTIIALIILLIACVNFMNLSTARSEKRAKEVGIRKTLGSGKRQLILQFFFESMILAFIAFILSIALFICLLPSFNTLVDKHLSLESYTTHLLAGSNGSYFVHRNCGRQLSCIISFIIQSCKSFKRNFSCRERALRYQGAF